MNVRACVVLFATVVLVSSSSHAAAPVHKWSQGFGNGGGDDWGWDVAVDGSGNVFVTGYFQNTVDFGGGNLVSAGNLDMFLAKYDANGVHQWSQRFGSTSLDEGESVAVDGSGNVFVTGRFTGTVDFGGGNLVSAGEDIVLAKYDANGVHQWSHRFGSTGADKGGGVAVDGSGNVVVTGVFQGTVDFGGGNLVSAGNNDIFLTKYDANGVHQWSHRFGSTDNDTGLGVAVDGSGNVWMTGDFIGTVDFGGGNLASAGTTDVVLAKYDASGIHQWSQRFGSTSSESGFDVAVDGSGNAWITGGFRGTVDFGGGNLASAGNADIVLAKYNASGVHQWSQRFGSTSRDTGYSVAVDGSGNVSCTGYFDGTVDFGGGNLVGAGFRDVFLATYDTNGVHQWSKRFGSTDWDEGDGIAADVSGNVWITGAFRGTVDFGGGNLVNSGFGSDIFLAKYGPEEPVPVLIQRFNAITQDTSVELQWDVRADEGIESFRIERAEDSRPFETVAAGRLDAGMGSYTDASVQPGETYQYALELETAGGVYVRSPVATVTIGLLRTSLGRNYPNPFNPNTTIEYTIADRSRVVVGVYDASGALVVRFDEGMREAGTHRISWGGKDTAGQPVGSGVYFYRFEGTDHNASRKMILFK